MMKAKISRNVPTVIMIYLKKINLRFYREFEILRNTNIPYFHIHISIMDIRWQIRNWVIKTMNIHIIQSQIKDWAFMVYQI